MPGAVQSALRERTWTRLIQASFLRGEFVLSSGRKSSHYIDKYRFETRPDLLRDIARLLAQALPPGTTALAGAAVGGVPIATAVALETGLPFVIVRPETKGHGTARTIEGILDPGDRVVVLEDVVTTGAQVVRAARAVASAGAEVLLSNTFMACEQSLFNALSTQPRDAAYEWNTFWGSVKRATVFECDGAVKHVPWAALEIGQQPEAALPPPIPPAAKPAPAAAPSPAPNAPPQTMVDLAKQANEKTAEQVQKAGQSVKQAGETVKEATKKTWDCVFSFFTRC